jgi:hypothetical protein
MKASGSSHTCSTGFSVSLWCGNYCDSPEETFIGHQQGAVERVYNIAQHIMSHCPCCLVLYVFQPMHCGPNTCCTVWLYATAHPTPENNAVDIQACTYLWRVVDVVHTDHHVLALSHLIAAWQGVWDQRAAQQHRGVGVQPHALSHTAGDVPGCTHHNSSSSSSSSSST